MNGVLIISPSGKLYGSESVLIDYITNTKLYPYLLVPANSDLQKKLTGTQKSITIKTFKAGNIPLLYARLFMALLFKKYKSVYVNEAGHVKYILLLAKYFPNVLFTVHVRMLEDTANERWSITRGQLPQNVNIISISEFISKSISFHNFMVPDPFVFTEYFNSVNYTKGEVFHVGIVGRVTMTKGIGLLALILDEIRKRELSTTFTFHLFGELSNDVPQSLIGALRNNPNVLMHGYLTEKSAIYNNLHAVMHLSRIEPLGRVFFEAVDHGLPFIGINAAGIGEIARQFNYNDLIIKDGTDQDVAKEGVNLLTHLVDNYDQYRSCIIDLKKKMRAKLSVTNYCTQIDNIITNPSKSIL